MKKIKIGILGASALAYGKNLASYFDCVTLASLFDTNKNSLDAAQSEAKNSGIYLKTYNNADDFYATDLDMVLAGKNMYDYIFLKNTYLTDGTCDLDFTLNGIGAKKDGELYIFSDNEWTKAVFPQSFSWWNLSYIKCKKDPLFAYFLINFLI